MSDQLKPQFFITRHNGSMVPLIALDELPSTVTIRGIHRQLTPYDICGMTGVGTFESRHQYYIVDGINNTHPLARPPLAPICVPSNKTRPPQIVSQAKTYGIEEQPPRVSNASIPSLSPSVETQDTPKAPSSLPPWHDTSDLPLHAAPGTKEYCSYWLRHGECDYAQQGCLYKHEMPLSLEVLKRLGLRDLPRWYREKHGLRSYLAATGTDQGSSETQAESSHRGSSTRPTRRAHKAKNPSERDTTDKNVEKLKNKSQPGNVKMTVGKTTIPGLIRFHSSTISPAQTRNFHATTYNQGRAQSNKHLHKAMSATNKMLPSLQSNSKESVKEWQLREAIAGLGPNSPVDEELEVLQKQFKVSLPGQCFPAPVITATPSSSSNKSTPGTAKEITPSSSANSTCNEQTVDESIPQAFAEQQVQDAETISNHDSSATGTAQHVDKATDSAITYASGLTLLEEQDNPISLPALSPPNAKSSSTVLCSPKEGERDRFYDCE